jgi:hypothetical protein
MDRLIATTKGLENITKAIQDIICNKKQLKVQSIFWIEEASKCINPDWQKGSVYEEGISMSTWKRFMSGKKQINKRAFIAFCELLNLDWQKISETYSFPYPYGFKSSPKKRNIFNSYSGERIIHNLWIDPVWYKHGGCKEIQPYVKPMIVSELLDSEFLRLEFVRQGWGVNVTIRPENDIPVDVSGFENMKISFKSPGKQLVGLRVRVIDSDCVHWGYGQSLSYENKDLSTDKDIWKTVSIPLKEDTWFHFPYDGYLPKQYHPNFDAINLITFEIGIEPSSGSSATITKLEANNKEPARIDIKPIVFY